MGRFYQTSQSNFIADNMLDLPYDLMSKVILNADKNVDDTISGAVSLYDKLQANALQSDKPRLNEIVKGYESSIDEVVSEIQKNPLEYSRKIGDIRNLGRKIQSDFSMGEVAAIENRYNQDADWWKEAKELQKKNPELYTDEYLRRLRQKNIQDSGIIDYKGYGDYNPYVANSALGLGNMNEWVDERLKDAIPNAQSVERDTTTGNWIVTTKEGTKSMSAGELNRILQDSFNADVSLQNALRQREQLEMQGFTNLTDLDGNFISPSSIKEIEMVNEKGEKVKVPQLQFMNNMLGSAFKAGVEKFGFTESESTRSIKADPYGLKRAELQKQKDYKDWEENRDENFLRFGASSTMDSPAGTNIEEFTKNIEFTQQKMQNVKDNVGKMVKSVSGMENLPPEVQTAIDKGNFSYLYNLEDENGEPLFDENIIKKYEKQLWEEDFNMSIIQGTRKTWENRMEEEYKKKSPKGITLPEYIESQEPRFNSFLQKNDKITVPQTFTFEGTGIKKSDVKALQKEIVDSGLHMMYPLETPEGTTALDKNGNKVDITNLTAQQLLMKGVIEPVVEKVPYESTTPEERNSEGVLIKAAETTTKYRFVDGSGYINFSVSPESIAPATSFDDDRKLELGMIVDLRGKKVMAKIGGPMSSKLKGFENLNYKTFMTDYYITKASLVDEVPLPGGSGMKIKNVGGTQFIETPDGEHYDLSRPEIKAALAKIIP